MTCLDTSPLDTAGLDSTVVTAANPAELSPLEAAIMDLCNALHEARLEGSGATAEIERDLFELLERYEESGADDHPNAAWAIPNQRALALSAAGRLDQAIDTELIALQHADNPRRLEISLGNLAERCIKLHRYDEAVAWFLEAQRVAPGRTPILITGAQALCLAGFRDEADAIFATLLDSSDQLQPGTELDAYLRFETRLSRLADELPSLRRLLDAWQRVQASAPGGEAST